MSALHFSMKKSDDPLNFVINFLFRAKIVIVTISFFLSIKYLVFIHLPNWVNYLPTNNMYYFCYF